MRDIELFAFQKKAIRNILKKVFTEGEKNIILKAPTGSGKTVILSKLTDIIAQISEFGRDASAFAELGFSENEIRRFDFGIIREKTERLEYIWLSPSTGGLAGQSKSSFERNISTAAFDVHEFVANADRDGSLITFIGVSSINKEGNILRRDTENLNWTDVLSMKHTNGVQFGLIIDESHLGDTDKRQQIIEEVQPIFTIMASATPVLKPSDIVIEITDAEVIEEGLITKRIRVNHELPAAVYETEERKNLVDIAVKMYKKLRQKYIELNNGDPEGAINPLIIIQYPDRDYGDELFEEMDGYIHDCGYNDTEIAKWLTVKGGMQKENLDGITDNDSRVIFLHMKQAAATGWDCPRAKILVKLRDRGSSTFETQVIGRIRRMPERKHYEDAELDSCYIYTYDDQWIRRGESTGTFTEGRTVTIKPLGRAIAGAFNQKYDKEYKTTDNSLLGAAEIRKILESAFISKYGLNVNDKSENLSRFKMEKYRIGDRSNIQIRHGDASTIDEISEMDIQTRRRIVRDGDNAIRRAKEEISVKSKLNDSILTGKVLMALFRKKDNIHSRDVRGRLLELDGKAFNAFVVNNKELLARDIKGFLEGTMNQEKRRNEIEISRKPYTLPDRYEVKCDTRLMGSQCKEYEKNLYDGTDTSMKTSMVESRFQSWLDKNSDWWIKNGDVGEDFLSVVYVTATGKQYAFYPDYICQIKGRTWVIEAKGGENADGSSANIDPQAENKFYALKDYTSRYNDLNFGFVRYVAHLDSGENACGLYISTTDYTEEMHLDQMEICRVWKYIDVLLSDEKQ